MNRPPHRGGGGPVQNDVMRYLQLYAKQFNWIITDKLEEADVVITNDCFTSEVLKSGKPKVKRMDGIFSRPTLLERNQPLNAAAEQADSVIFISKFSYASLQTLYPKTAVTNHTVALNAVDVLDYYPAQAVSINYPIRVVAIATNWNREEKRGDALRYLAERNPAIEFHWIGTQKCEMPSNCVLHQYQVNYLSLLQSCHAMIHLGWQDPAPKTVSQGLSCGLPVFFTHSGGTPELVEHYGQSTKDEEIIRVTEIPTLNMDSVQEDFASFLKNLPTLQEHMKTRPHGAYFRHMLEEYFTAMKAVV